MSAQDAGRVRPEELGEPDALAVPGAESERIREGCPDSGCPDSGRRTGSR